MNRAISVSALSSLSILLNFIFQTYVLAKLGAGTQSDAFFTSLAVPQMVTSLIAGTLMNVLVPILAGESRQRLARDGAAFLFIVGGSASALAVVAAVTAGAWAPLLAPGFSAAGKAALVELSRIQMVGMASSAIVVVLTALWHVRGRFVVPELSLATATGLSLAGLVWALPHYGIRGAAWLAALRMTCHALVLLPIVLELRLPDWTSAALPRAWRRIRPLLVAQAFLRTSPLVDRFLASLAPAGGLSLLYLGRQMLVAAHNVLDKAIVAPAVPSLAAHAKSGRWEQFSRTYRSRLLFSALPALAGLAVVISVGEPLLALLAGRVGVSLDNLRLLRWILLALGGVLVGGALGQVVTRSAYAAGDTATPVKVTIVIYTIALPLQVLAFLRFGLFALPLTTSVQSVVGAAVQMWVQAPARLQRRLASQPEGTV